MSEKVTIITIANLDTDPITAQTAINANFQAIAEAIDLLLSRDGTEPNPMTADLDMGGYRIINLGAPVNATDAARDADMNAVQAG